MGDADTLDQLIQAAIDAGIPALHLVREDDGVRILVRTLSGLAPVRSVVARPDWLDAAQALPHAPRRGERGAGGEGPGTDGGPTGTARGAPGTAQAQ